MKYKSTNKGQVSITSCPFNKLIKIGSIVCKRCYCNLGGCELKNEVYCSKEKKIISFDIT
jgi:hypothetical protein